MSIRLRLILWYGLLFASILLVLALLSYTSHARAHYDDLDRALASSVGYVNAQSIVSSKGTFLTTGGEDLEISLRLYDTGGTPRQGTNNNALLPPADPQAILAKPAGPAYDPITGLVPPLTGSPPMSNEGAFGLVSRPDQRWRIYAVPLLVEGKTSGYLEALAPLGQLDQSLARWRNLFSVLGFLALVLALTGSWLVAGRALQPVTQMIQMARKITLDRDFSHRIALPSSKDELGHLAETFNEMLATVEETYNAQHRFVADASHELRAPLTVIQGNLELLRRQHQMSTQDREEALAEAEREATRLTRLVGDLLALARADAGGTVKQDRVELDAVVLEALGEARSLSRGQSVVLETFEPVEIRGDADRLKQLLLVLLDNAIKYTPAEGKVSVDLKHDANHAEIRVRDTGIGIPPEAMAHVFERFYRGDPARARDPGGTGLGLSIARWIVEQHRGQINLSSEPGHGTAVTVELPVTEK